jgi:hypothetical protein
VTVMPVSSAFITLIFFFYTRTLQTFDDVLVSLV